METMITGTAYDVRLWKKRLFNDFHKYFPRYAQSFEPHDDGNNALLEITRDVLPLTDSLPYDDGTTWKILDEFCTNGAFVSSFMIDSLKQHMQKMVPRSICCLETNFMQKWFANNGTYIYSHKPNLRRLRTGMRQAHHRKSG